MFDVHPPHAPIHNWRDILLQLAVVTMGLLIALALEGCVEWLHHRHLVHQAETSLHTEIATNAGKVRSALDNLHAQQAALEKDASVLDGLIAHPDATSSVSLDVSFSIKTFDDVSWKTAQATGAVGFMPYDTARRYAEMYGAQDDLAALERQAARDTTLAIAPLVNMRDDSPKPTKEDAALMKRQIEVLQGQLLIVDQYLRNMDRLYKAFLSEP